MHTHHLRQPALLATVLLACIGVIGIIPTFAAPVGTTFTYQGQLFFNGTAVGDGTPATCDFTFDLYDVDTGGTSLGTDTVTSVTVTDSYFAVELDFGTNVFAGDDRYLEITVDCPSVTSGAVTLTGRVKLNAVPYAQAVPWGGIYSRPANLIYVATSGGDFQTISAALTAVSNGDGGADGYTDASSTNPYTLKVAPGTYDEQVTMVSYVHIEGAGEEQTIIRFTGGTASNSSSATVIGAANSELRWLTVESNGPDGSFSYAFAIYNASNPFNVTHVTARVSGNSSFKYGVINFGGTVTLNDVTASATGVKTNAGVYNFDGPATLNNVTASASGGSFNRGVFNFSSTVTIQNSTISGTTNSIFRNDGTVRVANTQLDGPVSGTVTCVGAYDASFVALDTSCQ